MTVAERMVYERLHGRGSAPHPTPPEPDSFEEHRERVETQLQDLEQQQAEIKTYHLPPEWRSDHCNGIRDVVPTLDGKQTEHRINAIQRRAEIFGDQVLENAAINHAENDNDDQITQQESVRLAHGQNEILCNV